MKAMTRNRAGAGNKPEAGSNGSWRQMQGLSAMLNLLPAFPEKLSWNESREKGGPWIRLFKRVLELHPGRRTQEQKATLLLARGEATIQKIAFNQRAAPNETKGQEFENLIKRCEHYFEKNSLDDILIYAETLEKLRELVKKVK